MFKYLPYYIAFLLLFGVFNLQAQQRTGIIKVRKKMTHTVCLNGHTDGVISPSLICGGQGVYVSNTKRFTVTSFVVLVETYKSIEERISGNLISGEICDVIETLKTGDIVYISKIQAFDNETKTQVSLPSLRFQINAPINDSRKQRYSNMQNEKK